MTILNLYSILKDVTISKVSGRPDPITSNAFSKIGSLKAIVSLLVGRLQASQLALRWKRASQGLWQPFSSDQSADFKAYRGNVFWHPNDEKRKISLLVDSNLIENRHVGKPYSDLTLKLSTEVFEIMNSLHLKLNLNMNTENNKSTTNGSKIYLFFSCQNFECNQ